MAVSVVVAEGFCVDSVRGAEVFKCRKGMRIVSMRMEDIMVTYKACGWLPMPRKSVVTVCNEVPLKCKPNDSEVAASVSTINFTSDEVVALHVHYDPINSAKQDDGLIDRSEFQTA